MIEASLGQARANILKRIRNDYEAAQRREALLASAYEEQMSLVSEQAEEMAHYKLLKREVDASRMLYESLLQKLKEASIASACAPATSGSSTPPKRRRCRTSPT